MIQEPENISPEFKVRDRLHLVQQMKKEEREIQNGSFESPFCLITEMAGEGVRMLKSADLETSRKAKWIYAAVLVIVPVLLFYMEAYFTYQPFERTRWRAQLLNILFLEMLMVILLVITCRAVWALRIETIFVLVAGLANYYVISFRGNPIVPWDFLSLHTAVSVAGEYSYKLGGKQILLLILFVALLIAEGFVKLRLDRKRWVSKVIPGIGATAVIATMTWVVSQDAMVTRLQLYPFLFTPNVMYERNGFAVTFLMDLRYLSVKKPDGYNSREAEELLSNYGSEFSWVDTEKNPRPDVTTLPNVLVIMDEAFSDVGVLGSFQESEDALPFVHSLQNGAEGALSGMLQVSVKGGNTANTEFEFLTGQSMAFLPAGSIPYQQYITDEIPSLGSYLKSMGYQTIAMHPYYASGWNRDKVYPLLGFSTFLSKDDYTQATMLRGYVDDKSCAEKMIELYEQKKDGQPLFAFQVTMQNHSPYDNGYQLPEGNIEVNGSTYSSLSLYQSLIKKSDEAVKELVEYFKSEKEHTVIVFFGDHQPSDSVVAEIAKAGTDEQEKEARRYEVPYVIWANYNLQADMGGDTSANFLAARMMKAAGIPLSDYQEYQLALQEKYPVISTQRLLRSDGSSGEMTAEEITDYNKVQYYLLFDKKKNEE